MIVIGTPHTHNAGHYYNFAASGRKAEADVQTCTHCEAVILMQQWKASAQCGWCAKCNAPLCSNPACIAETERVGCVPFIKKLEQHMECGVRLHQHLKIAGLEPPVSPQPIYTG